MQCACTFPSLYFPFTFRSVKVLFRIPGGSAVSGTVAEEPVVSKYGHVFERRLIEKYLETHDTDPVTNEPLTTGDLIALKGACHRTTALRSASQRSRSSFVPAFSPCSTVVARA